MPKYKISIFGLGYVGTVTAACFSQMGYSVIGVEPNEKKVNMINSGESPVIEKGIDKMISEGVKAERIIATKDSLAAVLNSDISFICVGTPSNPNGSLNLTFLKEVSFEIGHALKKKKNYHLVVFRSTMLPGTIEDILLPIIEKYSSKTVGIDFGIVMNPEFLREGSAVFDFYNPPKIILGVLNEDDAKKLIELYKDIDAPMKITSIKIAEMVKYVDNVFHSLKVTFANEVGRLCKKMEIDSHEVMDIFCLDTKLNLSSYYLKPGFAFGGSCLPKDLSALIYKAKRIDVELPLINSIPISNELQIKMAFRHILSWKKKRIGILGFAFKEDTDDLRKSPMVKLIELLLGKGYKLKIYDEYVSLSKLLGANKEFIEEKIPHISNLMVNDIDSVIDFSEIVIIGTRSEKFARVLHRLRSSQVVLDLVRIAPNPETKAIYNGICW